MSDSFDNLLARTEHRDTAPAGPCPDAEVLAAYLDATLTPAERDRVEAHAADCGRCALQLGTVVRLEDVSGAPQHAPVRRWSPRLAWMVPAVTAVLVGAVYVALPSRGVAPAPPPQQRPASDEPAELKEREASHPPALRDRLEERNYSVVPPTSTAAPSAKSIPSAAPAPAPPTDARPRRSEPAGM
jgi:Putative zinc-finger